MIRLYICFYLYNFKYFKSENINYRYFLSAEKRLIKWQLSYQYQ